LRDERPIFLPGEVGDLSSRNAKDFRAEQAEGRVAFESLDRASHRPLGAEQVEQQTPPPNLAVGVPVQAVQGFLAVNLADAIIGIERALLEQQEKRPDVPPAVFYDPNRRLGKVGADFVDQRLPADDRGDDQVEGQRQTPERRGEFRPEIAIVDMQDDGDLGVGRAERRDGRRQRDAVRPPSPG
jgi:hypothetical protein